MPASSTQWTSSKGKPKQAPIKKKGKTLGLPIEEIHGKRVWGSKVKYQVTRTGSTHLEWVNQKNVPKAAIRKFLQRKQAQEREKRLENEQNLRNERQKNREETAGRTAALAAVAAVISEEAEEPALLHSPPPPPCLRLQFSFSPSPSQSPEAFSPGAELSVDASTLHAALHAPSSVPSLPSTPPAFRTLSPLPAIRTTTLNAAEADLEMRVLPELAPFATMSAPHQSAFFPAAWASGEAASDSTRISASPSTPESSFSTTAPNTTLPVVSDPTTSSPLIRPIPVYGPEAQGSARVPWFTWTRQPLPLVHELPPTHPQPQTSQGHHASFP